MTKVELEEEFFRVEGFPASRRACAYVGELERGPKGDRISAEERAALWYLAYWSAGGVTRPSLGAVAIHLNCTPSEARVTLAYLVDKGLLSVEAEDLGEWTTDVCVFRFPELRKDGTYRECEDSRSRGIRRKGPVSAR